MTNAKLDTPDIAILKACLSQKRDVESLRRAAKFSSVAAARIRAQILIRAGYLDLGKKEVAGRYRTSHRNIKYEYTLTEAGRQKLEELGEI